MSIDNSIGGNLRISADNIIVSKAASICFMHDKAKLDEFKSIIPKRTAKPKTTPPTPRIENFSIFMK